MPGYYESEWDKAKTAFEKDSGKIIAVVEKEALAGFAKKFKEMGVDAVISGMAC